MEKEKGGQITLTVPGPLATLLHPTYFPNIATFATLVQRPIKWEVMDNYQKQTLRNRCYICTDIGKHMLNVPIRHVGSDQGRQKYREVRLENDYAWQRQHWRTLETAYRTSPFFEFYEDAVAPLYHKSFAYLLDFNLKTIEIVCHCLQVEMPTDRTTVYEPEAKKDHDARFLVSAKKNLQMPQEPYAQVFDDRHGFVANTSILDLLFNEGPNALAYLRRQKLGFLNDTNG